MGNCNSNSNYKCDVFLNHRGPDTKDTIASSLYWWLSSRGLQVFLDREKMQGGLIVTNQIKEAIASATVHVAIFSPRYAESTWCLEELHLMIATGKTIIPIFYRVTPRDVRGALEHRGSYAADLDKHERARARNGQRRHNSSSLLNWRNALFSAAAYSGFDMDTLNNDLGRLLFKVYECVFQRLEKPRISLKRLIPVSRPCHGIKESTDSSRYMKMIVLTLGINCVKCRTKALATICKVEGVESLKFDVNEMKLTVTGSVDPICLAATLRKLSFKDHNRGPC